jgi:hypothetical protein
MKRNVREAKSKEITWDEPRKMVERRDERDSVAFTDTLMILDVRAIPITSRRRG